MANEPGGGKNVDDIERVISVVAGTALALFGLKRFSLTRLGLAGLGGSLIYRGVTGYCGLYQKLGVSTADPGEGVRGNLGTKIERAIVIYAEHEKVYLLGGDAGSRIEQDLKNCKQMMESGEAVA